MRCPSYAQTSEYLIPSTGIDPIRNNLTVALTEGVCYFGKALMFQKPYALCFCLLLLFLKLFLPLCLMLVAMLHCLDGDGLLFL